MSRLAAAALLLSLVLLASCGAARSSGHPAAVSPATASAVLDTLSVKGRAPMTGYARREFGEAWTDDTSAPWSHNGLSTREDVLSRDLTSITCKGSPPVQVGSHCVVVGGVLHDPYTGRRIDFVRGASTSSAVQIDHVVALAGGWQTGAQQLSVAERLDLANDPLELVAVDGPTNQAKRAGDAATWLPPNKRFRCAYVARQVAVKAKYRLWVTAAEKAAITRVLSTCPNQLVPTNDDAERGTY